MSALTPIGRPVRYSAGNAPIVASGRLNRMMNGVIERVEGQHHHHVDEQDGDAHRGEQPAERLGLLLGDAGEPDVDARPGSCPSATRASISDCTVWLTAPVSSSAISAVMDAAGASSMRVIVPWAVDLLDGRDGPERHLGHGPDRQRRGGPRRSARRPGRPGRTRRSPGRPRRGRSASPCVPDERRADVLRDLGRGEADHDRLVGVGRDLDLGRALGQVALEVEQLGVVGQGRDDRLVGGLDLVRVVARDDDVEAVRGEAGGLRDRDVVAVGLDRRERVGEVLGGLGEVDRVVEADGHPGAVGRPAALGGDDGLEAGVALARDASSGRARRRRSPMRICLGLDGPLEHGLGAGARRRRDGDREDLLRAGVDERGRQERGERGGRDEQRRARRRRTPQLRDQRLLSDER